MDKVFTVALSASDRDDRVALDLPAEPYTVLDAWERLRPAPDARVRWELEDCGGYPALASVLKSGEDFPALNSLAHLRQHLRVLLLLRGRPGRSAARCV